MAEAAHSLSLRQMSPCESVKSAQTIEVSGMEENDGFAGDSPSALSCPCYVEYENLSSDTQWSAKDRRPCCLFALVKPTSWNIVYSTPKLLKPTTR